MLSIEHLFECERFQASGSPADVLGPGFDEEAWRRVSAPYSYAFAPTAGRCLHCGNDLPRWVEPILDGDTIMLCWRELRGHERCEVVPPEVAHFVRLIGLPATGELLASHAGRTVTLPTRREFEEAGETYLALPLGMARSTLEQLVRHFGFGASVAVPYCPFFVVVLLWVRGADVKRIARRFRVDPALICALLQTDVDAFLAGAEPEQDEDEAEALEEAA